MSWATLRVKANRVALDRLGSVSITSDGASSRGFNGEESQIQMGETFIAFDRMITAEANLFRSLGYGDRVTVDGSLYSVVHEPLVFGDGTWCRIPLQLVPTPVVVRARRWLTTLGDQVRVTLAGQGMTTLPY